MLLLYLICTFGLTSFLLSYHALGINAGVFHIIRRPVPNSPARGHWTSISARSPMASTGSS